MSLVELSSDTWRVEALDLSRQNPGMYVIVENLFGPFASLHKRLNVFAPTDSHVDEYFLNGVARKFTSAQRAADSAATPQLS